MSKPTIICVDDERVVLISIRDQLRQLLGNNYDIELAESGAEALEILEECREEEIEVPLIISDQIMPGMKGDELLIKIHEQYPKIIKIMLTGQASGEAVGNAVNLAKLYRYLAKPWQNDDLNLTVKEALNCYFQDKKLEEQNALLQELNRQQAALIAKLQENEYRLQQFIEAMPVGVFVADANGHPYYINSRAQELLGKGTLGNTTSEQLTEVYQMYLEGSDRLYPNEENILHRALQGESTTADNIEIHQDHQIIPIEAWGTPIYNEQGELSYAIAAFQDITERKKSEKLLRASERRFRAIFNQTFQFTGMLSVEGILLEANQTALDFGQLQLADVVGKPFWECHWWTISPDTQTQLKAAIFQAAQGQFIRYEVQILGASDTSDEPIRERIATIDFSIKPILDDIGKVEYLIVEGRDISDRKQAEAERERFTLELLRFNEAFSRFVPRQFLHFLDKKSITDVQLGDAVQKQMSVLFSDIRDFTTLSESMTPQENFKFINSYLSRMSPIISEHQGFIDKYIGDAIMALFSGTADNAVKAGITMLQQLAEYNEYCSKHHCARIQIGIGINTGDLMLGTVGEHNRMDGTVISDAVNLASRLEGLTKQYGVSLLISHQTFVCLTTPEHYTFRLIDKVKVKGKSEVVTVYEVFDADSPEIKAGKLATKTTFERAWWLYHQKDFREAVNLFEDCLHINPGDKVAQIYLTRCQKHFF